jgi:DNA-binding NtrC family response regulator
VARIRETARLAGATAAFARSPEDLERELSAGSDLVIVDLTASDLDHGSLFDALDRQTPRVPVLGYTTHALARQTRPLHPRCDRVMTREMLTAELGSILKGGLAA